MITLTENTLAEIRRRAAALAGGGRIVRLGVKEGGCSGTTYLLDFDETVSDQDTTFSQEEFTIAVDPVALPLLNGMARVFKK